MFKKLEKYKIVGIIFGFIAIILKSVKYGEDKIKLKQFKQNQENDKIQNEVDDIIDNATNDERSKLL